MHAFSLGLIDILTSHMLCTEVVNVGKHARCPPCTGSDTSLARHAHWLEVVYQASVSIMHWAEMITVAQNTIFLSWNDGSWIRELSS